MNKTKNFNKIRINASNNDTNHNLDNKSYDLLTADFEINDYTVPIRNILTKVGRLISSQLEKLNH